MEGKIIGRGALVAAAVVMAGALTPVAAASTPAATDPLTAMQRDLGLTAAQARGRLAREDAASRTEPAARAATGAAFGGAWLDPADQRLVVGITDPDLASRVRALGADPRAVRYARAELDAAAAKLDRGIAPRAISSWYVDVVANRIVVEADPSALAAVAGYAARTGIDAAMLRIVPSAGPVGPLYDVRGGDAYTSGGLGCSIGFSVNRITAPSTRGYVTAGHCVNAGATTTGSNGVTQGTVLGRNFPGNDYAWVQTNANWTPRPLVNLYDGGTLNVQGWREAAVGASVCRSGMKTGWRCGTIQAKGVTVTYSDGSTVYGVTKTSVCSDKGDSGGPFLNGSHAQGVTSGGVLGCTSTGTTFFQPVVPILSVYQLRLLTAGSVTTPPVILRLLCQFDGNGVFSCILSWYHPDGVQIRWTVNGAARSAWNNLSHVTGGCGVGQRIGISATISNSSGSDTAGTSVLCEGEPQ